jgi:hypothetical protein
MLFIFYWNYILLQVMGPDLLTCFTATSAAMTTPIEQLPRDIPCLKPNGTNWAIISMHFHKAMQATHCWGHFNSTKKCPSPLDATKPSDDELAAIKQWECEDQVAHYLLF